MRAESIWGAFKDSFLIREEKKAITFMREGRVETDISYRQLDLDSSRMASGFLNMGVQKGDRVILFLQKSLVLVVAHLALQKLGAISVPLNPGLKKFEMEYLVKDADARLILTDPGGEDLIDTLDPSMARFVLDTQKPYQSLDIFPGASENPGFAVIRSEDPSVIIYTSGTTGKPKGAALTHKNLVYDARNVNHTWKISGADVFCHALPLFHLHGLSFSLHTAFAAGAHVLMLDRFDPHHVLDALSKKGAPCQCTVFMAVPAMYGKLMETLGNKKADFSHLRLLTSGSAPLLTKDFDRIARVFGKEPVEREGMTETGMNFSNPLEGNKKKGSIGLPLPGLKARIVNPDTGNDVLPGQTGEIWLKGPAISPGYWRKPVETADAFEDGWFKTGDLGNTDADGYYYLTDRIKNIIISGGENISPKEVEETINRVEGVTESAVIGIRDEKWGEKVVAAIVKEQGSDVKAEGIQAFCKQHLHDWKCPKKIAFAEKLPRNTMGKVLKDGVEKLFH